MKHLSKVAPAPETFEDTAVDADKVLTFEWDCDSAFSAITAVTEIQGRFIAKRNHHLEQDHQSQIGFGDL